MAAHDISEVSQAILSLRLCRRNIRAALVDLLKALPILDSLRYLHKGLSFVGHDLSTFDAPRTMPIFKAHMGSESKNSAQHAMHDDCDSFWVTCFANQKPKINGSFFQPERLGVTTRCWLFCHINPQPLVVALRLAP